MTNRQFTLLLVAVFLTSLDLSIFGPALNTLRALWHVSERLLAWGVNIYVLTNLIGIPLLARASDVFGRRRVLLLALAIFAVGSIVIAQAPNFELVLVGRAIQGFGAGGLTPVVIALIGDTMSKEKQGGALGMIGVMLGLGFIVGPVLGGVLLHFSWRLLFWVNVPLCFGLIVALKSALPVATGPRVKNLDGKGLLLLTAAFGALALGLSNLDVTDWSRSLASVYVWPFFVAAAALLPALYWVERRAVAPLVDPALLGRRQLLVTNILSFGAGLGLISVQFMPSMAKLAFGVSDAAASLMLVPGAVTFVVGSFVVGMLLKRVGPRKVLLVGGALLAIGYAVFSTSAESVARYYVGSILLSLGLSGASGPPLRFIVNLETTEQDRGSAQALLLNIQIIGQLTGGALIGALAGSFGGGPRGYGQVFFGLAFEATFMALLALGLQSRAPVPERAIEVQPAQS